MKALKLALAISLVLNLALVWMHWRDPGTPTSSAVTDRPSPASVAIPLEVHEVNLNRDDTLPSPDLIQAPNLTTISYQPGALLPAAEDRESPAPDSVRQTPQDRPYADPLPPNPHAVPLWERRVPYREGQWQRGLYQTPVRSDADSIRQ